MRIDDVNRAPQAQETEKAGAVRSDGAKNGAISPHHADSDAASISELATALSPNEARLETLRLQVERGEYRPAAQEVAASIIEQHTIEK